MCTIFFSIFTLLLRMLNPCSRIVLLARPLILQLVRYIERTDGLNKTALSFNNNISHSTIFTLLLLLLLSFYYYYCTILYNNKVTPTLNNDDDEEEDNDDDKQLHLYQRRWWRRLQRLRLWVETTTTVENVT